MPWPALLVRAGAAAAAALRNPAVRQGIKKGAQKAAGAAKTGLEAAKKAGNKFATSASRICKPCAKAIGKARGRSMSFSKKQLQKKGWNKNNHAADFGIKGNYSPSNANKFQEVIQQHVGAKTTKVIQGTYRGNPVTHFVDPKSGLNVIRDSSGAFQSGWRLNAQQLQNVIGRGKL